MPGFTRNTKLEFKVDSMKENFPGLYQMTRRTFNINKEISHSTIIESQKIKGDVK